MAFFANCTDFLNYLKSFWLNKLYIYSLCYIFEANDFYDFIFWDIFGDWKSNTEQKPLENFRFKEPSGQTEEFTEYKITAILTDLESNDYFNIHAEIF